MNRDPLDDLLRAYARQPLPPAGVTGKARIWQEIEERRQHSSWNRLFPVVDWDDLFREPRVAIAGLALALLVGSVPIAAAATLAERPRIARDSLHLKVFTICPSRLSLSLEATRVGR